MSYIQKSTQAAQGYDTAQICLNGHVITGHTIRFPKRKQDFCSKCGERTITACPNCNMNIRGESFDFVSLFKPPGFCQHCGKPFPWTEIRIEAAKELAQELGFSAEDIDTLSQDIDELVRDSPRTTIAATRFKRIAGQAGVGTLSAFKELLAAIVVEGAKRIIWP